MRAMITAIALLSLCALCSSSAPLEAAAGPLPENPLAPFERIIGGEWRIEGSHQTFEWAVENQSVVARSYRATPDGDQLVGQGMWFWHPGEERIRGYFVGVGMGIDLFVYSTRFEEDRMVNQLVTHGDGGEQKWEEIWDFRGEDEYVWTLYRQSPEGREKVMGDTYKRRWKN